MICHLFLLEDMLLLDPVQVGLQFLIIVEGVVPFFLRCFLLLLHFLQLLLFVGYLRAQLHPQAIQNSLALLLVCSQCHEILLLFGLLLRGELRLVERCLQFFQLGVFLCIALL